MTSRANEHRQFFFGTLAVGASIGSLAALYLFTPPSGARDLIVFGMGQIFGWGSAVYQFHYGSSEGAKTMRKQLIGNGEGEQA